MRQFAGSFAYIRSWLLSRSRRKHVTAAEACIKAGEFEQGISLLEAALPRITESTARVQAVRSLIEARLQRAKTLRQEGDETGASQEIASAVTRLDAELTTGPLTAARRAALLDLATQRLAALRSAGWAGQLRGAASPALAKPAIAWLEKVAEGVDPKVTSADMRGQVAQARDEGLPAVWWLALHSRLYRLGFVGAAIDAKRIAAHAVLATPPKDGRLAMHLAAAVHVGDDARISSLLSAGTDALARRDGLLAMGRIGEARELDRAFAAHVEGKTIAVVEPAENTLGNGAAIDAHDLVARTNFVVNDGFREQAHMLGTRTTAAYYNSIFVERSEAEIAGTLRSGGIEFAMLRSPIECARIWWLARGQRTRHYHFTPTVFMARGYAMRHLLNDLGIDAGKADIVLRFRFLPRPKQPFFRICVEKALLRPHPQLCRARPARLLALHAAVVASRIDAGRRRSQQPARTRRGGLHRHPRPPHKR
ncbi:hypothetical protein ACFFP0_11270 [Rhizobium puerariae]|uniref:Uncharacterized protein n=1 Tax=Rhizobium puerariae TaxID=1585791 RepID=A0ABV6AHR4_9HYPH